MNVPPSPAHPERAIPVTHEKASEFERANALDEELPLIKTCGSRWFAYDGKRGFWHETSSHLYRPIAQAVLPPTKRVARRARELLSHLEDRHQCEDDIFRGTLDFETPTSLDRVIVNTQNGIVRVTPDAITLLDHDADRHFTRTLAATYDPSATCPLFDRTLGENVPDPLDQHLLQLCVGNFLLPDCRFETAYVFQGEAGTGKDTIAAPIAAVFGDSLQGLITRLSMAQLCDPKSYSLPKLRYACVNLGTELDSLAVDESTNFKTIVSGEPFEAREIRERPFSMHTHCKLWSLTNYLPRFRNGTEAELRRMRFTCFEHVPTHRDPTLKSRLRLETSGVLNFMLTGLQRLLPLHAIPYGGAHSRSIHDRFKFSNDPLGTFMRNYCVLTGGAEVSKDALLTSFNDYCAQFGVPEVNSRAFFKDLYDRYTEIRAKRARSGDERTHMVVGLTLKEVKDDSAS